MTNHYTVLMKLVNEFLFDDYENVDGLGDWYHETVNTKPG